LQFSFLSGVLVCALLAPFLGSARAAPLYSDVTDTSQLSFTGTSTEVFSSIPNPTLEIMQRNMGSGAAVGDYDGDGDLDVYMLGALGYSNKLFRNDYPTKTFTDVTAAPLNDTGFSRVAHFVDLDNDGDEDLVLLNDDDGSTTPRSKLFRNEAGVFTDVSSGSGFRPVGHLHCGMAIADYDLDGLLDIYITVWSNGLLEGQNRLYRNLGNFSFQEVTSAAGLGSVNVFSFGAIFTDLGGDHYPDLLVATDGSSDIFYDNVGGAFTDATLASGATHFGNDMGVAAADYDDDGDLDIYQTNITDPDLLFGTTQFNVFYENQFDSLGSVVFVDEAANLGVEDTYWGWGTEFVDVEQDGDLDIVAVTGYDEFVLSVGGMSSPVYQTPSVFFVNGGGSYSRQLSAGLDDPDDSRALIAFDYDRDGDQDLLITNLNQPARLLENVSTSPGHWLNVELEPDAMAIGASVHATTGSQTRRRDVIAGRSYLAGHPSEAHFGLGTATTVDTLTVVWADGRETTVTNVAADQMITITAPPFIQVPMLRGYGLVVLVIMLFVAPLALGIPRARAQRVSSPKRRD
jgi:hypothetical protein